MAIKEEGDGGREQEVQEWMAALFRLAQRVFHEAQKSVPPAVAGGKWSAARTELLRRLDVAIPSSRRRYNRIQDLEQALAATGVYLAGLKIYDEDPTARRIVERNLELLRNGAGGQGSGVGEDRHCLCGHRASEHDNTGECLAAHCYTCSTFRDRSEYLVPEERATCGKCGATVVEAAAGWTVGDRGQGIVGDQESGAGEIPKVFSVRRSVLIKWAVASGRYTTWLGDILEDVEGYAPSITEGVTLNAPTNEEPRTVFESHAKKYPGTAEREGFAILPNGPPPNGESYNAAAANLRAIMPTANPIWEPSDGKSVPPAVTGGQDPIWNPADAEEFERWAQQFGMEKIPGIVTLVTLHTAFRNARSQGWHARNSGLSMAGYKIPPEGGTTNLDAGAAKEWWLRNPPEGCALIAHDTGDGWDLCVTNDEGEVVASIKWPEIWGSTMSSGNLRRIGFEVV